MEISYDMIHQMTSAPALRGGSSAAPSPPQGGAHRGDRVGPISRRTVRFRRAPRNGSTAGGRPRSRDERRVGSGRVAGCTGADSGRPPRSPPSGARPRAQHVPPVAYHRPPSGRSVEIPRPRKTPSAGTKPHAHLHTRHSPLKELDSAFIQRISEIYPVELLKLFSR